MIGSSNALTAQATPTNQNLSISLNGSNTVIYNGKEAKSINITAASVGAALSNHNHDSLYSRIDHSHVRVASNGRKNALTDAGVIAENGISMIEVYDNGYPVSYGNVIRLRGGGSGEILCGWSGTSGAYASMYYRSQRDTSPLWSDWAVLLDNKNFSNYAATSGHNHDTAYAAKSHTHTRSQISDFPGSLPANGGNSDTVDGLHASAFAQKLYFIPAGSDMNKVTESGFYRLNSGNVNSSGLDWSQMIVCFGGGDTIAQINIAYNDTVMKFRGGNPPDVGGSGTWTPWSEVLDRRRFNPTKIQSGAPVSDALWAW